MNSNRLGTALVLLLFASLVGAEESKRVVGRVLDKKSPKNQPVGVSEVIVKAFNDQGVLLISTTTNDQGEYILEGIEPGAFLVIEHSKVNYLRDPEPFRGSAPSEGVTVSIGKKNGDLAYYKEVGDAIVDRSIKAMLICHNTYGGCVEVNGVVATSLESEWRSIRDLDLSPDQTSIIWEQVANQLSMAQLEPLIKVDASITASRVNSLDPDTAAQVAGTRGFNPDIYFKYDESEISADVKQKLIYNAAFLQASQSFDLIIEGHADERGTNEYNMALADKRASAVRDFLVGEGLSPDRIRTLAYGEERPVCTDTEEACSKLNRRAHFVLRPKTSE